MPKIALWLCIVLVFELAVTVMMVSPTWIDHVISTEQNSVQLRLGLHTKDWVEVRSINTYNTALIHSGVKDVILDWLTFNEKRREISPELNQLADQVEEFSTPRIHNLFDYAYIVITRSWTYLAWSPLLLVLVIPVLIDGWCVWRVRLHSYNFASPVVHRMSLWAMIVVVFFCLGVLLSPWPITPSLYPVTIALLVIALYLVVINTQKRV